MQIQALLAWLQALPPSQAMRDSGWLFPAVESGHVVAISLVVGSIMIVDLRLLGITSRHKPVTQLAGEVLPWTWGFFVVAVATGLAMFASKAEDYFENPAFQLKMLFLLLAGLNMAVFHLTAYRSVQHWDHEKPTLFSAKVAGGLSLLFWIAVVTCGRWIAFVNTGAM